MQNFLSETHVLHTEGKWMRNKGTARSDKVNKVENLFAVPRNRFVHFAFSAHALKISLYRRKLPQIALNASP